jgi:hypothetical protein
VTITPPRRKVITPQPDRAIACVTVTLRTAALTSSTQRLPTVTDRLQKTMSALFIAAGAVGELEAGRGYQPRFVTINKVANAIFATNQAAAGTILKAIRLGRTVP